MVAQLLERGDGSEHALLVGRLLALLHHLGQLLRLADVSACGLGFRVGFGFRAWGLGFRV